MTKDEALRLALEALENSWTEPNNEQYEIEKNAITAIKEALETKDEPFEYWNAVGWFGYDTGLRLWFETDKNDDGAIPLYKDQQQRTWVGLTDEEIESVYMDTMNFQQNARVLEAKLKEKNT